MSWCDFMAGWAGGTIGLVIGHPFDTVKVNQQAHDLGLAETTRNIRKYGWYKGFFRGLGFPLLANGSVNSMFFGSYAIALNYLVDAEVKKKAAAEATSSKVGSNDPNKIIEAEIKELMAKINELKEITSEESVRRLEDSDEDVNANTKDVKVKSHGHGHATNTQCFLAGATAGVLELCIACPVELIKIKLQSTASAPAANIGPYDLIRKIKAKHGVRGFYQGLGVMALRDIPARGIYMLTYHICSKGLKHKAGKDKMANIFGLFLAGGLAGTVSWCSIIPIDVIKSRLQTEDMSSGRYKGIYDCTRQIYAESGWKGFVRGGLPLALRAFPVNGATFLTIEWLTFICRNY